jgi:Mn2+/Fe2+ NRAMP family transporter
MILATAATLHAHGQTSIETTAQAAQALKPVAGEAAFVLFGVGIVGTGLLALPVLAGSAAYAFASLLGVRKGLDHAPGKAPAFYAILAAAMLIGLAIGLSGINPMKALVYAAIINALASVPIMVGVMLAASSPAVMGNLVITRRLKIVGWAATGVMLAAAVATVATALV